MEKILKRFDGLAGIVEEKSLARWLERVSFFFMMLMFLAEPHSIAATQTAWLAGLTAWIIRLFVKPRPKFVKTGLNFALLAFFGWSLVTAVFSYAPDISLDRLRGAAVLFIFFFVLNNLRTKRAAIFLVSAMIFSAMIPVVWTPFERLIGRGVEVQNLSADNPFLKGTQKEGTPIQNGDTIFAVGKKKIRSPEALLEEIEKNEVSEIWYYRPDYDSMVEINRADLPDGANALEKLGIGGWKHSHNWRSAGTYGHYTTFAEVLQLIGALISGLFISAIFFDSKDQSFKAQLENLRKKIFVPRSILLFFCAALTALALLLTVTRASQIGLLAAALAMLLAAVNRKFLLIFAAIIVPLGAVGVYFQQQSRNVGFFDSKDDSTRDRMTFYRKGFDLWTKNARNFTVGIGMDSSKRFIEQWDLYDNEHQPMGHFHSTPLQLLVERGIFALFIWLWVLYAYGKILLRELGKLRITNYQLRIESREVQSPKSKVRNQKSGLFNHESDWKIYGVILGCFGGMVGFFVGGLVHYNLGDAEVAMAFYMLMGIGTYLGVKYDA